MLCRVVFNELVNVLDDILRGKTMQSVPALFYEVKDIMFIKKSCNFLAGEVLCLAVNFQTKNFKADMVVFQSFGHGQMQKFNGKEPLCFSCS